MGFQYEDEYVMKKLILNNSIQIGICNNNVIAAQKEYQNEKNSASTNTIVEGLRQLAYEERLGRSGTSMLEWSKERKKKKEI